MKSAVQFRFPEHFSKITARSSIPLKYAVHISFFVMIAFSMGLAGCASTQLQDSAWPEPRPLGGELGAYRPPLDPVKSASTSVDGLNPTAMVTLPQALSLALMKNPELAAFSWEVRVGEARTLQAGLPPNPEIGLEVEEFAGSEDRQGVDAATSMLQLSQLIELGGKRSKRAQVAALERDLAGWDYEAKRLDV